MDLSEGQFWYAVVRQTRQKKNAQRLFTLKTTVSSKSINRNEKIANLAVDVTKFWT